MPKCDPRDRFVNPIPDTHVRFLYSLELINDVSCKYMKHISLCKLNAFKSSISLVVFNIITKVL